MLVSYWSDDAKGFIVDNVASLEVTHPVWASYGEDGAFADADVLVRVPVEREEELLELAAWASSVLEEDLVAFVSDDLTVGKWAMTVEDVQRSERGEDEEDD